MNNNIIKLIDKQTKKIAKKGYYDETDIHEFKKVISDYEFKEGISKEDSQADELLEKMITIVETLGYKKQEKPFDAFATPTVVTPEVVVTSDEVEPTKETKKSKGKVVKYALAAAIVVGGVSGAIYMLDKDVQHEIVNEQEQEQAIAFDVNDKEQLKLAVDSLVEEAAQKGVEITAEEALDFFVVANTSSIDTEKMAYIFSSKRTSTDMVKNFNIVMNKLSFDAFTVKNNEDFVNVSKLINDGKDAEIVNKFQILLSNMTSSIIDGNKELKAKTIAELTKAIDDLFIDSKYTEYSAASNIINIKQLIVGFTLDESTMDVNDRIAIYGSETCDKKSGSILDTNMKQLENEMEDKYSMMQNYVIAKGIVSEYETVLAEINSSITASVIADSISAVDVQLLAHTGTKIDEKTGVPAKTTTVTTITGKTIGTPATDPKKLEEAKTAITEKQFLVAKDVIAYGYSRGILDTKDRLDYQSGTASYYSKQTVNSLYAYDVKEHAKDAEYLKYYEEGYALGTSAATEQIANYVAADEAVSRALVNFKAKKSFNAADEYAIIFKNRPEIIKDKKFMDIFAPKFASEYQKSMNTYTAAAATAAANGLTSNIVQTGPDGTKDIYNENGSSFIVTHENRVYNYGEEVINLAETDLVCVKDSTGKELFMTLGEARAAGYKSIYVMVDETLKEIPLPEKGKTR